MTTYGIVELFNFKEYNENVSPKELTREGSDKDIKKLRSTFEKCTNAQVREHPSSMTTTKFKSKLLNIARNDFTHASYLLCFFSSHGDGHGIMTKDSQRYPIASIIKQFKSVSKELEKLPKIFIVQACRGETYDHGYETQANDKAQLSDLKHPSADQPDAGFAENWSPSKYSGPIEELLTRIEKETSRPSHNESLKTMMNVLPSNSVVAFSTPPDRFSWRSISKGGHYVRKFTETLQAFKENNYEMDIIKILTETNQKLAIEFASATKKAEYKDKKQIGEFVSNLKHKVLL